MAAAKGLEREEFASIAALDEQIALLFECKPLPEADIRELCAKVSSTKMRRRC